MDMRLLFALILLAASQSSFAFSNYVHQLICSTAYELSSQEAKAFIEHLMKQNSDVEDMSFPEACIWPNTGFGEKIHEEHEHHLVVTPHDLYFEQNQDCVTNDCIAYAIQRYALNLSNPSVKAQDKKEALLLLGILVGDIHQPLYVVNIEEHAGNTITVFTSETDHTANTDLYAVWESSIPYKAGLGHSTSQQELLVKIAEKDHSDWQNLNFVRWAQESLAIGRQHAYAFPDSSPVVNESRLTKVYYDNATPIIYEQVMKASMRLAFLLDQAASGLVLPSLNATSKRANKIVNENSYQLKQLEEHVQSLIDEVQNLRIQISELKQVVEENSAKNLLDSWVNDDSEK